MLQESAYPSGDQPATMSEEMGQALQPEIDVTPSDKSENRSGRIARHSENARKVAEFLAAHPKVAWVNDPGLESSPEHAMAQKYLPRGASGVLCFGVKGGVKAGETLMNSLKLAAICVHVADLRTCVLHPASMTHRQLSEEELIAAGVSPDLIRLSIGLENIEDIIADFEQAFAKI